MKPDRVVTVKMLARYAFDKYHKEYTTIDLQ